MRQEFLGNTQLASLLKNVLNHRESQAESRAKDYQAWRTRFMLKRLRLGLWMALIGFITFTLLELSNLVFRPQEFQAGWLRSQIYIELCLLFCLLLHRSKIGRRYPSLVFIGFSWSVTLIPQITATLNGVAEPDILVWPLMFFGQATLTPMRWPLHLASQLGVFAYYIGVNAALGVEFRMSADWMTPAVLSLYLFWVCSICDFSVYLYERLQQAEFKARRELEEAYEKLEAEQQLSERLLLNILPASIAERLKQEQGTLADSFTDVSVLFADIVGFTELSGRISPPELVELLNQIFSSFDQLADLHQLEKIKTIGDAYMVVAGLPEHRPDHTQAIADMAIDMQQAIANFNAKSGQSFRIRIGIATGPVVAGVIGIKKFIYDLWGDTVNMASRMESHGLPDAIQVTSETYDRLKNWYVFQDRGLIQVKGKGEMNTYLLLGKKET